MAEHIIFNMFCRYCFMIDIHYLDTTFNIWELYLTVNAPSEVRKVKLFIDFEEMEYEKESKILIGMVKIYVETNNGSFCLDKSAATEEFHDDGSKDKAKDRILLYTKDYMTEELENGECESLWDKVDFEKEDWKKI